MRNKSLFLLLACVCGTIAAIGVSQWMQAQNVSPTELKTVEIFVTTKAVDVAEEITADKIRLEQWPADRIPEGSTNNLADLEGKFAKQRFYAGEPVMPVKLMDDANTNSATIPRGYSVVSMKADADSSASNLVRPGDRVDVMAYFTKSDLIPETTARTVLRGIRVFAIDGRTQREDTEENVKPARSISLLIHKNDAEAWTYATELGKVRLQLGNPGDYAKSAEGDEANPAGQEFLKWLADYQRAKDAELAKRNEVVVPPPAAPVEEVKPVEKPASFKMLKMSGDKLIEYEWSPGAALPKVVGDADAFGSPATDAQESQPETVPPADDYNYLNGAQSPFFQPKGAEPAGQAPLTGRQALFEEKKIVAPNAAGTPTAGAQPAR